MKAQCWWCEDGSNFGPRGMVYLHLKCFEEITDICKEIEYATKYAKGEMPRVLKSGNKQGYKYIERFLVACEDFKQTWNKRMEIIKTLTQREAQKK